MFSTPAARLVWDGQETLWVPPEMGDPGPESLADLASERLSELAARLCMAPRGRDRTTHGALRRAMAQGRLAALEHCQRTVLISFGDSTAGLLLMPGLLNRAGIWSQPTAGGLRLTLNMRTVLEWDRWTEVMQRSVKGDLAVIYTRTRALGVLLRELWSREAPAIVQSLPDDDPAMARRVARVSAAAFVAPESAHEQWVTLYIDCSRAVIHDLIQHGDFTAISTRNVCRDEAESPWAIHPLLRHHAALDGNVQPAIERLIREARRLYGDFSDMLVARLSGVAREPERDARIAARGVLGNDLSSDLLFSASVAQWRWILRNRLADTSDAAMREVMERALAALRMSRYALDFADMQTKPASNGVGVSLLA